MAWVGLADVVSLAVPFATGGGLIVDAITKSDEVVALAKAGDNIVNASETIYDSAKALDNIDIPDCFIAGTLVSVENGHLPIETIVVGDYVWATDPETGETELKQVVNTFVNETTAVTHVTVKGEVITSTQTHPYYVLGQGWTLASKLCVGDVLVLLDGEYVVLEQVQQEILESPVITYNFEVEGFHTYYVGQSNVLVHNKCKIEQISEKLEYVFGNASGNEHNVKRSQSLLKQIQSIGINDTVNGRKYMLEQMLNISNIVGDSPEVRYSSLLCGPVGIRQMDTVWKNGKLITVYIFGGL